MTTVVERFLERTPRSGELAARARTLMPGGDTRAAAHHDPYQLTYVRGEGCRIWDLDGNEYFDLLGNYSSLVHGNAYPPVIEAARGAMQDGTAWAGRNTHQLELAAEIIRRVSSAELVRMTNSGTEAAMLAIHIAKIATGRPKILMARKGYHGAHEDTEAGTFAGTRTDSLFGGPNGTDHATYVAEFGDPTSFEYLLADRGEEIAAVILEPVLGVGGVIAPSDGFLARVAQAARDAGTVFILDEIVTFRLAEGGGQSVFGAAPDLTLLGKIIGGGFPVGAVAGRADLLELTDPTRNRLQSSGTFSGNPVTAAAGVAALKELTAEKIERMDQQAAAIADQLEQTAHDLGLPITTRRSGSIIAVAAPDQLGVTLHLAALNNGLYFAPRGMLVLSTVFSDADVASVIERMTATLVAVQAERRLAA